MTADGATTSTVTVTLKDFANNPVSGKAVTLAKSAGPGTPVITGPAPATTGVNGQTTFTVKSTTVGLDTLQATDTTDSNLTINQTASVTFTAGPVNAAHSTVSANPGAVSADGITTSTVTVTLKDINDNPISGKAVTLARSAGPGSPVITGPVPATTGVNGQTTFTVKSTTSGLDTFQATDTSDGNLVITQTASVTFAAGAVSAGLGTVSANPNTVAADGSATSTVTVTLKDANSNPVSGKAVTLAKSAGPGAPVITGPAPATTGANGQTAFTVKSSTNGTDTFQATDATDGNLIINQTANVTFGPVSNTLSTVSANPGSVASDGVQSSTVTVTLKDANGNGVAGKAVSLAKSAGSGAPNIGAASGPSFGSGQVTFSVTSTTAGTDTFQATDTSDGNLVINQTTTITFTPGGYTLDGWGGVHSYGSAPAVGASGYWPGWDIARGIALCPENHNHGYTLDGWGGIHPFGSPALPAVNTSYWQGWDIARGIVLTTCTGTPSGYTLDGWGGIHQFGNAAPVTPSGYWQGRDIANAIALCPDSNKTSGYTLDGWGGVHPFGPAGLPNLSSSYWQGWDIARGIVLTSCSGTPAGYTLDGWGGIHAFGSATPATGTAYWQGWDIARGITALSDGSGGYVLDGWGGIHPWKATSFPASLSPGGYWPGWDIARGVASSS